MVPIGRGPAVTASPVQPPAAGHAPLSRGDAAAFPGLGTGFSGWHEAGSRVYQIGPGLFLVPCGFLSGSDFLNSAESPMGRTRGQRPAGCGGLLGAQRGFGGAEDRQG